MASVSGRKARVTFDYEPEQLDELRLSVGEIIDDVRDDDEGWCKGTLNGKVGLFPNNFVEYLPESEPPAEAKTDPESSKDLARTDTLVDPIAGKKAKVNFEYDAENDDELQLILGDVVDIIREVEDGWWEGAVHGRTGVFPSNFVSLIKEDEVRPPLPEKEPTMTDTAPQESSPRNNVLPDEEDANKRSSIFGQVKMKGGGMGFGNLMSADVLSNIKLKKVDAKKKSEPEEKAPASEPPVPGLKKTKGSSFKRQAPPVPPTSAAPPVPAKKSVGKAKVLFEYVPENDDELSLHVGNTITILNKQVYDTDGWWEGELNGKVGLFPDNFVEMLPDEEEPPKELPPKSPKKVPAAPFTGHQDKPATPPTPSEPESRPSESPRKEMKKAVDAKKPPPPKSSSEIEAKPHLPIKKPLPPKPSTKPLVLPKKPLPKPPIPRDVPPKPVTREPEVRKEIPLNRTTKNSSEIMDGDSRAENSSEGCNLDVVEPHETLQQLTVNRAKLQSKRPPSGATTRQSEGNLIDTNARQEPDGEREEKPIKVEPKEPAWKREARELREAKEAKEKVVPRIPSTKEKKTLIFDKREEKDNTASELRKSVELPTKTSDAASANEINSLRQEVADLKALVEEMKAQMAAMKEKHEEDQKKLEKRVEREIEQLTEDFDEQRNKFAKLEIDFDRLKKKRRGGSQDAAD